MNNFNYKKKYGQNFLIDKNITTKIVNEINVDKDDLIIEIGAGTGALTKELIKLNCQVLAYEIDRDAKEYLSLFKSENIKIIYDDFLKRNLKEDLNDFQFKNLYIVGNLPYYITTVIIEKIIKSNLKPKELIFMVQKEVAARLTSKPGSKTYGYITAYLNYYYDLTKLFNVSNTSFYPAPKVESSVIKLIYHGKFNSLNEEKLVQMLKNSFQFKRKTLLNNLKNYDQNKLKKILTEKNIKLNVRAEELTIAQFIEITNAL